MMICKHAVEKSGKIYLTAKAEQGAFKQVEWHGSVQDLENMVLTGELVLTRKPLTDLEQRLAGAPRRYGLVKELKLIRDMDDREEVQATLDKVIDWLTHP